MKTKRKLNRRHKQTLIESNKAKAKLDKVKPARYMDEGVEDGIYQMLIGPSKLQRLGSNIKSTSIKLKDKLSNIKLSHKLVIRLEKVTDSLKEAELRS